jgi:hypothetical protein
MADDGRSFRSLSDSHLIFFCWAVRLWPSSGMRMIVHGEHLQLTPSRLAFDI